LKEKGDTPEVEAEKTGELAKQVDLRVRLGGTLEKCEFQPLVTSRW
jgi:hypothetical protein